jgi:hypothetical protein
MFHDNGSLCIAIALIALVVRPEAVLARNPPVPELSPGSL